MNINKDTIMLISSIIFVVIFFFALEIMAERFDEKEETIQDTTEIVDEDLEQLICDSADAWYEECHLQSMAVSKVESNYNPSARNGNCVGVLQISPICVREVNRLLECECFNLSDREDPNASLAMFVVIMEHKNPDLDLKKTCQIWNPTAGEWYYDRVKKAYDDIKSY